MLTIVDQEYRAVRGALDAQHEVPGVGVFARSRSPEPEYDVVVARASGRGNGPSMEATHDLIEDFRPNFILLVGTAGGIRRRDPVSPGDLVIPDVVHYGEYWKHEAGKRQARYNPDDQPSLYLRSRLADPLRFQTGWHGDIGEPRPGPGVPTVWEGGLISTESLYNAKHPELLELLEFFSDSVALDMESVGVGRALYRARFDPEYNPQHLVVRGITDDVEDPEGGDVRETWRPYAAAAAAAFVRELVRRILSLRANPEADTEDERRDDR